MLEFFNLLRKGNKKSLLEKELLFRTKCMVKALNKRTTLCACDYFTTVKETEKDRVLLKIKLYKNVSIDSIIKTINNNDFYVDRYTRCNNVIWMIVRAL